MIFSTTGTVDGRSIVKVLGLVSGSTVRARNIGRDISALFKNIVGGEVSEYTALLAQSREEALERMTSVAVEKGANAVIGMRFMTSMVSQGSAEILAYGTAVVLGEDDD
ncbi:MAG: YbjQ family protein, partial [SAR202 cluster bacterium]|nr:YbjQ family protein [SAR202 cluster bacterium]